MFGYREISSYLPYKAGVNRSLLVDHVKGDVGYPFESRDSYLDPKYFSRLEGYVEIYGILASLVLEKILEAPCRRYILM